MLRSFFFLFCFSFLSVSEIIAQESEPETETETIPLSDTTIIADTLSPESSEVNEEITDEEVVEEEAPLRKPTKNFIKMNLWNIPLRNYSFQVERVLTKRFSLAIGYRVMPEDILPQQNAIKFIMGLNEEVEDDRKIMNQLNTFKVSNVAITPEIRLYLSKKGYGRGFYLAPYYRMATYTLKDFIETYPLANRTNTITGNGKITSQSIGIMMGAQWKLGRFISLDWWIVGAQIGKHTGEFTAQKDIAFTGDERDVIMERYNQVKLPNLIEVTPPEFSDNTVKVSSTGIWGGIRAGLCLGISF